ncbi:hypothetical protein HN51_014001 [Arachis hypogaea]|uniref:60S ribosomal protein L4-like n=1 Tax=Arachis ipaensis TaxID=130454 RepID=UPI0007AF8D41|nr:60S ribosomal protein L4-like [Arachis ipaensis]XP_025640922.1 60S ribosomal protein L4-like [Arachis hypogaea]
MGRGKCMFAPTKIWCRKINVNHKRYAVVFAIVALVIPLFVVAHNYHIDIVPNLPLVISDVAEVIEKTKEASNVWRSTQFVLKREKYVIADTFQKKGPHVVYESKELRMLKSSGTFLVLRLQILRKSICMKLVLGGHLKRFVI